MAATAVVVVVNGGSEGNGCRDLLWRILPSRCSLKALPENHTRPVQVCGNLEEEEEEEEEEEVAGEAAEWEVVE